MKTLGWGLVCLLGAASVFLYCFLSLNYATSLEYKNSHIEIKRDQFNIPQIRAPSFESAMYAWGYVMAQDRLFQIGFRRQIGQGRLSQLFGNKTIGIDKMMRQLNFYNSAILSEKRFRKQNQSQYENFDAYAKGINDCVKKRIFMPFQYYLIGLEWTDWSVADQFLMYKLLKWSQSFNMIDEYYRTLLLKDLDEKTIREILPYQEQYTLKNGSIKQSTIVKDDEIPQKLFQTMKELNVPKLNAVEIDQMLKVGLFDFLDQGVKGSNSWVIGGNLTESGHPILANDPHLDSALPGEWHQVRVTYIKNNQSNQLIVAALPGIPIWVGKSSYFSVALTTTYGDSQDLYKQTLNDQQQYLFEGEWRPLKIRQQTIKVKGEKEPLNYRVYETHHGPIIKNIGYRGYLYDLKDENISLCWSGFTTTQYKGLKDFVHAAEQRDYETVIKKIKNYSHDAPVMNLLYITADDHYGYLSLGAIPKRRHPHLGMFVKDGSKAENDWIGFIKPQERLHIDNNNRGFIVTANNKPAGINYLNGVFSPTIYTARAERIETLIAHRIASGVKIDKEFMKQIQLDTVDFYCQEVVKSLQSMAKSDRIKLLQNFDCNFTSASTTASIYLAFYQNVFEELRPSILRQKFSLSTNPTFLQYVHKFIINAQSEEQINILEKAIREALEDLEKHFRTNNTADYVYGKFHQDWMKHRPFSESSLLKTFFQKISDGWGNQNTPNVAVMGKMQQKNYKTDHRANIRMIMSYHEQSEWIIDGGTSETFYSKHYDDQMQLFFAGKFIPMDHTEKLLTPTLDL